MKKIFYGWYIVIACLLLMGLCYAPLVSCASLFIKPITDDLGFSRSAYTLVSTISTLIGIVMAPIMGKYMSTKHMHKILILCVAGVSISYGMYSTASTLPGFYIRSVFVGLFAMGASMIPVSIVITNWFQKQRGLAMSIAMAGSGVGGAILSPLIGTWITNYGWRKTYMILAVLMFVVLVPICVLIVRQTPADKGLEPYGAGEAAAAKKAASSGPEWNVTLKELKTMPVFWAFVAGILLISLTGSIISHIPSAVMDAGYATTTAASIASMYLAIAVPGKLLLGHIFDKYGAKAGILFGNVAFLLSVIALMFIQAPPMLYLMAVLFGFGTCIGTITPSVLTSKLFGVKGYGETYGFVTMFTNAGFAFGVPIIASVYDLTGSYNIAWIIVAVAAVIMTIALLYSAAESKKRAAEAAKAA
ncbi:MAG: MFS transporter [Eubacteriales bacterium]|nr:MFS transporter [Eubacteriales bacterium]